MCIVTIKKKGQKPVTYTVDITNKVPVETQQDSRAMAISGRCGLVPTGRGRRGLIRGNTAAWR